MKLKTKNTNWPRIIIQWGVITFILLIGFFPALISSSATDFEAYCPFGGLQALGSYLLNQALSCTMTSAQIVMGLLLLVGVILLSKLFCAFICPVGTISEWLGSLGEKLKIRFTITGITDKLLRSLKYILLFVTLYITLQSNELFCKKFDPYYALASGFDSDVVIMWAIIALVVVIFGSVFIRLFWCKYLCPLGAISNIFKFTLFFVAVIAAYLILLKSGISISYVYPLAVACAGGFIIELLGQKSRIFPVAKITRNENSCTNCLLCTKKCPQGIDVASVKTVKHVDCNLCGDCLLVCPAKNTLQINKQKNFNRLPVIATLILVTLGIILGGVWEVPTIDERWADQEIIDEAAIFSQSGLKNIKCYGSSKAFANKMRNINGIYGVATFVKHNRVKIYYDNDIFTEEKIQELLFTPQKKALVTIKKEIETIYGVTLKLENFFDSYDFNYLSILLKQKTEALGIISEFGCPVIVKIYFATEIKNMEDLISIIESETLTVESTKGPVTVDLGYEISGQPELFTISLNQYLAGLFVPYQRTFNYRKSYTESVLDTLIIPLGKNAQHRNRINYLVSHLSNNMGIVEFNTSLDSGMHEIIQISFVDSLTNVEKIKESMLTDSLTVSYSNGRVEQVANPFNFTNEINKMSK